MSEKNQIEKRNYTSIFVATTVLFLGIAALTTYLWSKASGESEAFQEENAKLKKDIEAMDLMLKPMLGENATDDLKTDLENLLADFDKIKAESSEKSDEIQAQQDRVKGLLGELDQAKRNGRVSASLIAKLNRENETLREIMKGYVKQIDELNTKNLELATNLDETNSKLSETTTERDDFKQKAEVSDEKVKKGQKLSAYSINSSGLRSRINNKMEATSKARNCVQALVKFTIGANDLAEAGARTCFIQIINPDGKALQGRTGGTNGDIVYGMKLNVNYANNALDVEAYYDFNGEDAVEGEYKVKIYCGQDLIGSDSFTLR